MALEKQTRHCVLVIGPGLKQVGGVSTFVEILFTSPVMNERYRMIRLDTTRAADDLGLENRLSLKNLGYFVRQVFQFIGIIFRERPKLVHIQVTSGLAFWKNSIFILLGKLFGLKTVAHLHGGMFDQFYEKSGSLAKTMIGGIFRAADIVIALSQKWLNFLLKDVNPKIHVAVVRNTVDLLFAEHIENGGKPSSVNGKTVLFLGSLGQRKGVFDILQAAPWIFEKHPDARILLAGAEESRGEKQRIDQMCEEKKISDRIQFLGVVTGPSKLKLYQSASIYLLPSYGENLPFSLLEAMAAGLPVITTPVGAIPEIVEDGHNGFLIEPGDVQALARRIDQLLSDDELRSSMSSANVSRIKTDFMPETSMKLMDMIYTRLLSGAQPS